MIELEDVDVVAGDFALRDVGLRIPGGEYAVLMGRTGTGKTTLLEAICGLKRVTAGRILLEGDDITDLAPGRRGIGYVPQDVALFTHLRVREQLAFGPRVKRWPAETVAEAVRQVAVDLGIDHLLARRVRGLSGGEAQRVALGRALAAEPKVLCLDEPLSKLDPETHAELCALMRRVTRARGTTVLHITHNPAEAAELADRCFRVEGGRIAPA